MEVIVYGMFMFMFILSSISSYFHLYEIRVVGQLLQFHTAETSMLNVWFLKMVFMFIDVCMDVDGLYGIDGWYGWNLCMDVIMVSMT